MTSTPVNTKERRSLFPVNKTDGVQSNLHAISHSLSLLQTNSMPFKDMSVEIQNMGENSRAHVLLSPESPETTSSISLPFRSYCPGRSVVPSKETQSQHSNTVSGADALRKQLSNHWTLIGDMAFIDSQIETPSKSLVGEHSVGFSPPSIMRETLIDTWEEPVENADVPAIISQSSATSAYGLDWARVACGRTSTQLELIHRARDFVQSLRQRQTLAQ